MKKCTKCGIEKPLDDYFKQSTGYLGRRASCKTCVNIWRLLNKDKVANSKLIWARDYGGKLKVIYKNMRHSSIKRRHILPRFSFEDFTVWAFENGYKELYKAWEESGFIKDMSPSPDRIDNSKPYTFENMQLITWEENNNKG